MKILDDGVSLLQSDDLSAAIVRQRPGLKKAKSAWIQDKDANTAFFHSSIKQRLRQNIIISIELEDGTRTHDPNHITAAFLEFYKRLLDSNVDNRRKLNMASIYLFTGFAKLMVTLLLTELCGCLQSWNLRMQGLWQSESSQCLHFEHCQCRDHQKYHQGLGALNIIIIEMRIAQLFNT
ncbi:hypothetical protein G4B88_016081 [Cannabis sativa]|uniref:Uncharacterized protein n=1 Tax=Cannabis sativa TaxID=3483 RepID=A0A7J6F046_CANSA|nr:hypothetical protein G4B88_016081 [Cannabis sativa]